MPTTVLLKIPKDIVIDVILKHYGLNIPPLKPTKLLLLKREKRFGIQTYIKRTHHK
jgi:hypothetical protein